MTAPHIFSRQSKRFWLWLFSALLPIAVYVVIAEQNSWRPKTLLLEDVPDGWIDDFVWSPESQQIAVNAGKSLTLINSAKLRIKKHIPLEGKQQNESKAFWFSHDGKYLLTPNRTLQLSTALPLQKRNLMNDLAGLTINSGYPWRQDDHSPVAVISLDNKVCVKIEGREMRIDHITGDTTPATIDSIDLCDNKTGKALFHLVKEPRWGFPMDCRFSEDGKLVFIWNGGRLDAWQVQTGNKIFSSECGISGDRIDISWQNKLIAVWEQSGRKNHISVWDLEDRQIVRGFDNPDEIVGAQISPDGNYLAVGGANSTLTFWRLK
jgi:WD40 repeat protein